MSWSTVGTWCEWGAITWGFVSMIVQGSKQGSWRRIWNWPFKIGTGAWLLCFLLQLVPHSALVASLAYGLFDAGIVSFMVFVVGFLILVRNENKTLPPRRTTD